MPVGSRSLKFGWLMASQKTAGTDVTTFIPSAAITFRKVWTSKDGIITVLLPVWVVGNNWLLQPVTWNKGTDTRLRTLPSRGRFEIRRQFSEFDKNAS